MSNQPTVVREILSADGSRRVEIFRRADGTFGFEEWYFSDHPRELCWLPLSQQITTFAIDADTAEFEARGRIAWLGD